MPCVSDRHAPVARAPPPAFPSPSLPFRGHLVLPHHAQDLGAACLPALCRLPMSPQLSMVIGIVPPVTPAARDATRDSLVTFDTAASRV